MPKIGQILTIGMHVYIKVILKRDPIYNFLPELSQYIEERGYPHMKAI